MNGIILDLSTTLGYCIASMHPNFINCIENSKGLSDPALEENLKQSDYPKVLEALWSEKNLIRRVEWLQSKFDELHPVLMYELAIAKFQLLQNIETIKKICLPIFVAANFRAEQDEQCTKDMSLTHYPGLNVPLILHSVYQCKLEKEIQKASLEMQNEYEEFVKNKEVLNQQYIENRLYSMEIIKKSQEIDLPSSDWIEKHGARLFNSLNETEYSSEEKKERRKKFADESLEVNKGALLMLGYQDLLKSQDSSFLSRYIVNK